MEIYQIAALVAFVGVFAYLGYKAWNQSKGY